MLQLRFYVLENKLRLLQLQGHEEREPDPRLHFNVRFFDDRDGRLHCHLDNDVVVESIGLDAPVEEHRRVYDVWVARVRAEIRTILAQLPVLQRHFDVVMDVDFLVFMCDVRLCEYDADGFEWLYDTDDNTPDEPRETRISWGTYNESSDGDGWQSIVNSDPGGPDDQE